MTPEYDPVRGLIRLRRRHLEGIVGGDPSVLDPDHVDGAELRSIGVVRDGQVDAALSGVLKALREPIVRFGLRSSDSLGVTACRGWVSTDAVVTVSEPVEDETAQGDVVQDIRSWPRATSAARVVASLMDLGPCRALEDSALPNGVLDWSEVTGAVDRSPFPQWIIDAFGPSAFPRLHHLRWASSPSERATTAMVLLTSHNDGLVEVRPTEDGHQLVVRSPMEVWTGLCALTSSVTHR